MLPRSRLLRSALFCPADKLKVLQKTASLKADVFIYDLEDAVHSSSKITARDTLVTYLNDRNAEATLVNQYKPLLVARVNCPITTPWGRDDLLRVSQLNNIDAILLPKVESINTINTCDDIIQNHIDNPKKIPIWAMIETAKGVLKSEFIAEHESIQCLVFGSNDLTKDIKAKNVNSYPLLFSMSKCVLAARAAKKFVIDGVYMNIKNSNGLKESCVHGKNLGFDGKSIIHPDQIGTTNEIFSPSDDEINYATSVISAWNQARADGKSLTVLDGKLIEELHVEEARDIIEYAQSVKTNCN
jgi:citrate lyase beta subunit